eukprot:gene8144-1392_t
MRPGVVFLSAWTQLFSGKRGDDYLALTEAHRVLAIIHCESGHSVYQRVRLNGMPQLLHATIDICEAS